MIGLITKVTTTGRNIGKFNLILLIIDVLNTLQKMKTDDEVNGIKEIVTKIGNKSLKRTVFLHSNGIDKVDVGKHPQWWLH